MANPHGLTVSDIFRHVKRQFGDEGGVQVIEEDIIRWINDAQREAAMQNEGLLESYYLAPVESGLCRYVLNEDVLSLKQVHLRGGEGQAFYQLRWITPFNFYERYDGWDDPNGPPTGKPVVYTKENNNLIIYEAPSYFAEDGMKIVYNRYPYPVADTTDSIDLPVEYHSYVQNFCVMQAHEMDDNWEAADRKAQQVQGDLDFNNGRQTWFGRETYPVIGVPQEDI